MVLMDIRVCMYMSICMFGHVLTYFDTLIFSPHVRSVDDACNVEYLYMSKSKSFQSLPHTYEYPYRAYVSF